MKFPTIQDLYYVFKRHSAITTDSRKIPAGSVFFSLKGESFDGNQFAEAALNLGASYAVIDDETKYKEGKYILVADCLKTLQELAIYHRSQLKIPFIAITGSNGKTTTKELIKAILSTKYKTLATEGNFNNHIGVPLTILAITSEIEIAVIEMGANHIGEIAMLCEIAQPDLGLITNIGSAHIGEFGGFEGIIKAKTELYEYLKKKKGKIFINIDNKLLISKSEGIEKICYGKSNGSYCLCKPVEGFSTLKISYENEIITTHLIGTYNFENAAAAICIGKFFHIEAPLIKQAIEAYIPSNNRSQLVRKEKSGNIITADCYNANPSSMEAAINASSASVAILGDMFELGSFSEIEHKRIFNLAEKKFKTLILAGKNFSEAAKGRKSISFLTTDQLLEWMKKNPPIVNSQILLKGSRGMKMEKLLDLL